MGGNEASENRKLDSPTRMKSLSDDGACIMTSSAYTGGRALSPNRHWDLEYTLVAAASMVVSPRQADPHRPGWACFGTFSFRRLPSEGL